GSAYDQTPRLANPFAAGGVATPLLAPDGITGPGLVGGASAYGKLPASVIPTDYLIQQALAHAPPGATAFIARRAAGLNGFTHRIPGHSVLLFMNFGAAGGLANPRLCQGDAAALRPLQTYGWSNNPTFGGNGVAVPLTRLAKGEVFAAF